MTRQLHVDRVLDDWLAEGPSELPDRVIDGIVRRLDETPQRGARWLPGRATMNRMILALGGAAAVVAVAALALGIHFNRGDAPQPGSVPGPTSSPVQSSAPTSVPGPDSSPPLPPSFGTPVEPGRYSRLADGFRFTYDVPRTGWVQQERFAMLREEAGDGPAVFMFWGGVHSIYTDGCNWQGSTVQPPMGSSATELAHALASLEDRQASQPSDVTVGGYPGKHVQLRGPDTDDFAECDGGEYRIAPNLPHRSAGEILDFWILDLDGRRFVIISVTWDETPGDTVDEIQQIVESIKIEPET